MVTAKAETVLVNIPVDTETLEALAATVRSELSTIAHRLVARPHHFTEQSAAFENVVDLLAAAERAAALRDTLWQLNNAIDIVAVEL